ncbi:glycosyl hydrolase family 88 [Clostridium beijerinckii]|uniref:Glycosyl hydrolase family 88 n=1 Tax=Clostridium beijerinckii TaxID=1520 RepID=A0A0B5QRU0_CLOBE|nr:glycoside hydrolase family 88 protein [Clostridium beijerinckii]AJH00783.1 glycosyl hydrolase family 88 [Clostridium beijerinckii]
MLNENDKEWLDSVVLKIIDKMEWVSEKSANKIPYTTVNGEHDDHAINLIGRDDTGICWWTNGFWGGMMWLMYHETGKEHYREIANILEDKLDECVDNFYGLHHDVGFMWLPTSVTNYKITKNPKSRKRGLHMATLLAGRYNPAGEFIRAWNDGGEEDTRGWAIIDCMFNIPLLYWATEETNDPRFKLIAMKHADTVMKEFVRQDGSVNHIVEFDPFNGGVIKTHGGQGFENGSSWTRGQSWGLYGFLMSYKHTGKEEYLNTSKRIANYFIANIPEDGIIPVDFRQPKEPRWEDSTAAAIAACGFIEIAKQVPELEKDMYMKAAVKLLKTLDSKRCDWTTDCDCIVSNCTAAYHRKDHHFNIIYGDYYFMEAIFKLKGDDLYIW